MYSKNHIMCISVIQNFLLNGLFYINTTLSLQIFTLANTFFYNKQTVCTAGQAST